MTREKNKTTNVLVVGTGGQGLLRQAKYYRMWQC